MPWPQGSQHTSTHFAPQHPQPCTHRPGTHRPGAHRPGSHSPAPIAFHAFLAAEGLPSFLLVVHAVVNMTRQCCACFTALDPERGAALRVYYHASRSESRGTVMRPIPAAGQRA